MQMRRPTSVHDVCADSSGAGTRQSAGWRASCDASDQLTARTTASLALACGLLLPASAFAQTNVDSAQRRGTHRRTDANLDEAVLTTVRHSRWESRRFFSTMYAGQGWRLPRQPRDGLLLSSPVASDLRVRKPCGVWRLEVYLGNLPPGSLVLTCWQPSACARRHASMVSRSQVTSGDSPPHA